MEQICVKNNWNFGLRKSYDARSRGYVAILSESLEDRNAKENTDSGSWASSWDFSGEQWYYKGLDKASFCTSCETVTKVDVKDNGLIWG